MVTRRSKRRTNKPVDSSKVFDVEEAHDDTHQGGEEEASSSSPSKAAPKSAKSKVARASRGEKRSRAKPNDDESSDDPFDDYERISNNKVKVVRQKRGSPARASTPKKKRAAPPPNDESDDESSYEEKNDDGGGSEESDFEPEQGRAKSRRGRKKSASSSKKVVPGRGPLDDRVCPHCNKVMSTRLGLKYHIDNYVCRIDKCDDATMLAKAKRKRGKSRAGKEPQSKRFRGAVENRTCPHCKREFTSELGRNYHVKHKVCQGNAGKKEKSTGLDTLEPGSKFVTQFGVVEVVQDEREKPTGHDLPPNIKKNQTRTYQAGKARADAYNVKVDDAIASQLRSRRNKINELCEQGNTARKSMFNAYFGGDPCRTKKEAQVFLKTKMPQDPLMPPDFCPDRIVECILIPDKRKRFWATEPNNHTEIMGDAVLGRSPTRLFLQRRLLTEPYVLDLPQYGCTDCGRYFSSLPGVRYHVNGNVCVQRQASEAEKRKLRQDTIQQAAKIIEDGGNNILDFAPKPKKSDKRERRRYKAKLTPMYPEVLISLGFKVVKQDLEFTEDIQVPLFVPTKSERQHLSTDDGRDSEHAAVGDSGFDEAGVLLEHLREQLKHHQDEYRRTAADQKHGAMYVGVFKSLGYKKAKEVKQRERASKRRRRSTKSVPPPKPLPPIIDTRALADEIDSGRYPSLKRNMEDNHSEYCSLCRDGGDLVCCDFCNNAEHLKCIRKRFTVKDPEPEDDFMCHKCIQNVLSRRNRAEKRRLEKLQREEQRKNEAALEERRLNPGIQKGMEYPYMAERGQDLSELVEMMQGAQSRLKQALATSKMNNVRRKATGCYYTHKL